MLNAPLTIESLPVITYRDEPVCTTAMLAEVYGVEAHVIRQAFRRNRERYVEGRHFYSLEGSELQAFRARVANNYSRFAPAANVRALNLWTKRGAARHAKTIESDKAWDVFELLEEHYFSGRAAVAPQPAPQLPPPALTPPGPEVGWDEYTGLLKDRISLIEIQRQPRRRNFTEAERALILKLAAEGMKPTAIGKRTGRSPASIATFLRAQRRKAH